MSSDRVYRYHETRVAECACALDPRPCRPPLPPAQHGASKDASRGIVAAKTEPTKACWQGGDPLPTFILWIKAPMRPPTAPTNANGASSNSFLHPHPASRVSQYCPAASAPPCPTQNVLVQPNVPVQPPSILLRIRSARMPSQSGARFDVGNKAARKVCSAASEGHGAAIPLVVVGDFKHDQLARRLRIQALQRCKQPS